MARTANSTAHDWLSDYPPPRSLPLDQEAQRIYERAYYLGDATEDPDAPRVTFTNVLAALLAGDDDTSRWFAETAKQFGPDRTRVLAEKKITENFLENAKEKTGAPTPIALSSDKQVLTSSARTVLQNAEAWAQRVGGSDIGTRHLIAAYVLNPPPNHRRQMSGWNFDESSWRPAFFDRMASHSTWEQWSDASERPAPTSASPTFEGATVQAEDLVWPGDAEAMAILADAAKWHARRDDSGLRFTTLFQALLDRAEHIPNLRPLYDAVFDHDHEPYRQAVDEYFSSKPKRAEIPFAQLLVSPEVLNVLETARELAAVSVRRSGQSSGAFTVSPLQLAGALLSRRVDGDEAITAMGLDPQMFRQTLEKQATLQNEPEEVWRELLGEEELLTVGRAVDINSDEPEAVIELDEEWKSDPLVIRPDVEAFGALLASKQLEPPLSIGLFGPWGSGKTTFLKRLRRAVDRRSQEARKAEETAAGSSSFVSNVVHVEFNAWHFAEDALVSSLVDAILRALGAFIKEDQPTAGTPWLEQKRRALESTQRKVDAAEALEKAAQKAVDDAEKTLVVRQTTAAEKTVELHTVIAEVWTETQKALKGNALVKESGVLDQIGDRIKDAGDLRMRLEALRARPARLLGELGWGRSIAFALVVLALPPLAGWVVGQVLETGSAGQVLSSMAAILSVVGVWAKSATTAVAKVDQAIAAVADAFEKRVAEDKDVIAAQSGLDAARANAQTAAAGLEAARAELAQAQVEVANATLPAQVLRLVSSRLEDQSYKKELTTFSLAREDLSALSKMFRDQQNDPQSKTDPVRAVERVILYIDDLDRCKPEDVVRVLQVVHMLLAFELFVVVVAVDGRWVTEALRRTYNWLGNGAKADEEHISSNVTPEDYLQKIFQIAFWLEPMTAARAAKYLATLVRAPVRKLGGAEGAVRIDIAPMELDYMRALSAYVGPSPRAVKRLVNAYRLIKARMSDGQLGSFVRDPQSNDGTARSGPYQIVIGLLVIGTGAQSDGAEIMRQLAELDPTLTFDEVIGRFRGRDGADWRMAAQVVETLSRTQRAQNVSELRGWARNVNRFLLNSAYQTAA